ncbi:MAG: hypothetical protein HXS54_07100 [Theionarchaea archaeon]|nr:hypothetical protein [Theionarchaea archaeon]
MSPSNDDKAVQNWEKELRAEHRWGRLKKWFPEYECDERISKEYRWKSVWAYYITLKDWLPHGERSTGYKTLLKICDPEMKLQKHIVDMLGEPTELKQLYVQRFCANLEYLLGGFYTDGSPQLIAHKAAVERLENEISKCDSDPEMLEWMRLNGKKGWIEICHHKAFRQFDIHISSIGAGTWRQDMPLCGTDGIERALTLEKFLFPIEMWIKDSPESDDTSDQLLVEKIWELLGEKDDEKVFLASLLVSLLRSQQMAARCRAEKRMHAM